MEGTPDPRLKTTEKIFKPTFTKGSLKWSDCQSISYRFVTEMPLTDLALPKRLTLLERLKPFFALYESANHPRTANGLITYGAKLLNAD